MILQSLPGNGRCCRFATGCAGITLVLLLVSCIFSLPGNGRCCRFAAGCAGITLVLLLVSCIFSLPGNGRCCRFAAGCAGSTLVLLLMFYLPSSIWYYRSGSCLKEEQASIDMKCSIDVIRM